MILYTEINKCTFINLKRSPVQIELHCIASPVKVKIEGPTSLLLLCLGITSIQEKRWRRQFLCSMDHSASVKRVGLGWSDVGKLRMPEEIITGWWL